jgi:hypothetical protein
LLDAEVTCPGAQKKYSNSLRLELPSSTGEEAGESRRQPIANVALAMRK